MYKLKLAYLTVAAIALAFCLYYGEYAAAAIITIAGFQVAGA